MTREGFQRFLEIAAPAAALAVAAGTWMFRRGRRGSRPLLAAAFYGALPLLALGLWFFYASFLDRWGMDNLYALGASVLLFVSVGILVGALSRRLEGGR